MHPALAADLLQPFEFGQRIGVVVDPQVEIGPDWSEGRLTAASRVGRRRRAAANPRGMQGYAAGR